MFSSLVVERPTLTVWSRSNKRPDFGELGTGDQLPLDKVKIDKSFVRKVPHSATSREIVAGIIGLCRKLSLGCVLEGVETEDEMAILAPLQPEIIQGYLFGRPMPEADAIGLAWQADRELARHCV